jgi:antitoxin FitA
MAKSLTVRNVDDELVRRLKIRAAKNGRSAEAEHRDILAQALLRSEAGESFWEMADRVRKMTEGRHHTPTEILKYEDDDRR